MIIREDSHCVRDTPVVVVTIIQYIAAMYCLEAGAAVKS